MMPLMAPKTDERGEEMQRQLDDLFRKSEGEEVEPRQRRPDRDEWTW
jgi:hypothetical protein